MENEYINCSYLRMAIYLSMISLTPLFTNCSINTADSFTATEIKDAGQVADAVSESRLMEQLKAIVDARASELPREVPSFSYALDYNIPFLGISTFEIAKNLWKKMQIDPISEEDQFLGIPVKNIFIDFNGSDAALPKVLVIAHYDSWGIAAVDNAAGVSVVLELSNILKDFKLKHGVRLLLTDFEEIGLYGIQSYLRKHSSEEYRLVLNLDMLGYKSEIEPTFIPKAFMMFTDFPENGNFLYLLANNNSADWADRVSQLKKDVANLPSTLNVAVAKNGINDTSRELLILNADHSALWAQSKSPTLFLTTGSKRYPHYHKSTDSFDKIDSAFMLQNARMAAAIVAAAAGAEK